MLTRFFNASKPINHIVIIVLVLILFFLSRFWFNQHPLGWQEIFFNIGYLAVFFWTVATLNFFIKRNTLTANNSYAVFFFVTLSFMLPALFINKAIIVAGLFIALASRRMLSIHSQKDTLKKVLDATLWVCIASLFYFWSILFLVPVFITVSFYAGRNRKLYLVPFVSILIFSVLCITYALYTEGIRSFFSSYYNHPSFEYSNYSGLELLIPVTFILSLFIWTLIKYIGLTGTVLKKMRPVYTIVIAIAVTALILAVFFAREHNGNAFYFLLIPLSIMAAKYIESSKGLLFKELLIWLSLLIPFLPLFI